MSRSAVLHLQWLQWRRRDSTSCEAVCKITFTEQSLVSLQVISHSAGKKTLDYWCTWRQQWVSYLLLIEMNDREGKGTNMKSKRRMSSVFKVSWCHRSSALHRSDLIIINITLMATIRQSSAHVNHTMVYKQGHYSALSEKGKRWVQQSKPLLGMVKISQNDHKRGSFFSIRQHLSASQRADWRYIRRCSYFKNDVKSAKLAANLAARSLWALVDRRDLL